MDKYEQLFQLMLDSLESAKKETTQSRPSTPTSDGIPLGISNRHVHLSQSDLEQLFGRGYELTVQKPLSQPGQFACQETVIVSGPKGVLERVRVLGPVRPKTQVEILAGDCFKIGSRAEIRLSGDLDNTGGVTLIGAKGSVQLTEGLIIAQRHIHMHPDDAKRFGVIDNQEVSIEVEGLRGGILDNVVIRVTEQSALECHLDVEEANALGATSKTMIKII
jgi:propanediol utilization protein